MFWRARRLHNHPMRRTVCIEAGKVKAKWEASKAEEKRLVAQSIKKAKENVRAARLLTLKADEIKDKADGEKVQEDVQSKKPTKEEQAAQAVEKAPEAPERRDKDGNKKSGELSRVTDDKAFDDLPADKARESPDEDGNNDEESEKAQNGKSSSAAEKKEGASKGSSAMEVKPSKSDQSSMPGGASEVFELGSGGRN